MKRNISILNVGMAVLALSTALSAAADPSVTDAQAQAGALLTAQSHFHTAQTGLSVGADAQSQASAIISGTRELKTAHLADNAPVPLATHTSTPLARRATQKNADAQSMAATVLLGRGA